MGKEVQIQRHVKRATGVKRLAAATMGWRSSSTFLAMPILALTAALLLAPSLALGTLPTHSSPYSLSWSAQFSEQFRAGHLYPRWLSHSFSGLGAPTFYFYPPLSFWIDALVSAASFNSLSVSYRLSVTSFLALWASGIAMYAWLRHETSRETAALVGAIAFMAAPYHLFDHYIRGAFAEFTAYAVVPMVMLTLRLCAERRRNGPVLLALAYAALLMTHLPTAALMTVTLMPAYLLFRSCRLGLWVGALDLIARVAFGVMLGIGLAAIYIVPALTLQQWVSTDILWAPQHRPGSWLLLSPERWVAPSLMRIVGSLSMSAVAACGRYMHRPAARAARQGEAVRAWVLGHSDLDGRCAHGRTISLVLVTSRRSRTFSFRSGSCR